MKHANIIIYLNNGGISGPLNHRTTSYLFSCVNSFSRNIQKRCVGCVRSRTLGEQWRHGCAALLCVLYPPLCNHKPKLWNIISSRLILYMLWCNKFLQTLLAFDLHWLTEHASWCHYDTDIYGGIFPCIKSLSCLDQQASWLHPHQPPQLRLGFIFESMAPLWRTQRWRCTFIAPDLCTLAPIW